LITTFEIHHLILKTNRNPIKLQFYWFLDETGRREATPARAAGVLSIFNRQLVLVTAWSPGGCFGGHFLRLLTDNKHYRMGGNGMNTPAEIAKSFLAVGENKTRLPLGKMLLLAVLAGAYIGLAGLAASTASAGAASPGAGKVLGAAIFPAGLTMVILAGSELFTGNCLILIPVLDGRVSVPALLRNLLAVYLGNFLGGLLVAAGAVYSHTLDLFGGGLAAGAVATAAAKCSLSFGDALLRGVLCNLLVCLAVWMAASAKEPAGKLAALFFPIFVFVLCGFEHCVANMYYVPAGLLALGMPEYAAAAGAVPGLTWGNFLLKNLLPVTMGNLIGGMGLAAAYWRIYIKE